MVKVIITVRYRDLTGRYRCIAPYFKSRVHIGTTAQKESYTPRSLSAIPIMVKVIITVRYRYLTGRYRCIAPYFKSRVHIGMTEEGII